MCYSYSVLFEFLLLTVTDALYQRHCAMYEHAYRSHTGEMHKVSSLENQSFILLVQAHCFVQFVILDLRSSGGVCTR